MYWVKLSHVSGQEILVNLDRASDVIRTPQGSVVVFPTEGDGYSFTVLETPAQIMEASCVLH